MKLIGHYPTVNFPRSFTIDVLGRFVYAAGQRSNNLAAYRINQETGALDPFTTCDCGEGPIWVMCIEKQVTRVVGRNKRSAVPANWTCF